jgi:hypothetical protein
MIMESMTLTMTASPGATAAEADTGNARRFVGVMLLVLAVRILIFCTGLVALHAFPAATEPNYYAQNPWMAFDARAYRELALHGYAADRKGTPYYDGSSFTLIAYFPLVPLVARSLSPMMPVDATLLILSNGCSLVGFMFLYAWARRIAGTRSAVICTLIAATFPGAVSFAAGMTEGPFFMLTAMALWLLQRDCFWAAAILAGLGTALRPTGIALAAIIPLYAFWQQNDLPLPQRLTNFVLLGLVSFSGIFCYEGFLWHRYQTPTAYLQAQAHWNDLEHRRQASVAASHIDPHSWQYIRESLHRPQVWNRAIALAILAATLIGLVKKTGIPRLTFLFPLIVFLMTSLPGKGLRISSIPRYESAAIPLFLLVTLWVAPKRRTPVMILLLALQLGVQLYYAALFPRQIWVG